MKKLKRNKSVNQSTNNNNKEVFKMKKLITATLIAATIIAPVQAQAQTKAELKVDLFVNNTQIYPDATAYISNTNRTMVPISFISQAFEFNTKWDARKQEVKIEANGKVVVLTIGSPHATVNGKRVEVDPGKGTAPVIRNSRTMVPVAFIASSFGVDYGWTPYPAVANMGAGRVNFTKAGFALPVAPVSNLPLAPGGHTFEEGKALRPEDIPGARQTRPGMKEVPVIMTNADEVKLSNTLIVYPKILIEALDENGNRGIYMKANGGGATDIFYYKDGKRVGSLMTGDRHNGWMLIADVSELNIYDYMIFYGTEDKMVPNIGKTTETFNQHIRTINANQF